MKNTFVLLAVFFFFVPLQAQIIIEGTVYDAHSKEALPGVAVYLNGTSMASSSDGNGYFRLLVTDKINTALVFNFLGYEPLIIGNPFEYAEKTFFLHEKTEILPEAVVVGDTFSRAEKMEAFKEQFLGNSRAGKSCIILNEEDIVLRYSPLEHRLTAFSRQPLVIQNDYLAYLVRVDLLSFSIQYSRYTLNTSHIQQYSFTATPSFFDQDPSNQKIAKRRQEKYSESRQYFWKNFVDNTLDQANIKIYNGNKQTRPELHFSIESTPTHSIVRMLPDANLNRARNGIGDMTILGRISVLCHDRLASELLFMTDQITVDAFGNIDAVGKVRFSGEMGRQRIGDMIPLEYANRKAL